MAKKTVSPTGKSTSPAEMGVDFTAFKGVDDVLGGDKAAHMANLGADAPIGSKEIETMDEGSISPGDIDPEFILPEEKERGVFGDLPPGGFKPAPIIQPSTSKAEVPIPGPTPGTEPETETGTETLEIDPAIVEQVFAEWQKTGGGIDKSLPGVMLEQYDQFLKQYGNLLKADIPQVPIEELEQFLITKANELAEDPYAIPKLVKEAVTYLSPHIMKQTEGVALRTANNALALRETAVSAEGEFKKAFYHAYPHLKPIEKQVQQVAANIEKSFPTLPKAEVLKMVVDQSEFILKRVEELHRGEGGTGGGIPPVTRPALRVVAGGGGAGAGGGGSMGRALGAPPGRMPKSGTEGNQPKTREDVSKAVLQSLIAGVNNRGYVS